MILTTGFHHAGYYLTSLLLLCLLCLLCALSLATGPSGLDVHLMTSMTLSTGSELSREIVTYLLLPRTLMGILCGAALGAAGVLIQSATRNPFASPATLGVNAGALLATILCTLLFPDIARQWSVVVAFFGAAITMVTVFKLANTISNSPVNLVLVGMAVTLSIGALSAGLMMFWENRLDGLYVWGAGNLIQYDFEGIGLTAGMVVTGTAAALLLGRSLDLVNLGDDQAASIGIHVKRVVTLSLLLALILSATVVSQVGMIGFVGLVAPHIARGLGFQTISKRLLVSSVIGALLLLSADILARYIPLWLSEGHYSLPAGAMTTLIGTPFMIYLLTRRQTTAYIAQPPKDTGISPLFKIPARTTLLSLAGLLVLTLWISFDVGSDASTFSFRWPRVAVAALAGLALGVSGLVLQSIMKNPLASPDVSGLTTTGVLFIVVGLILSPGLASHEITLLSLLGSVSALALLFILSLRRGFHPQVFALSGLCLSALAATLVNIALVLGSNQSSEVLLWLSGSTYAASASQVLSLFTTVLLILPVILYFWRSLDLIALGNYWPSLLGVRVTPVLLLLLLLVSLLCSASVAIVGGISFVGLMAPHICRIFGLSSHRHLIPASALTGALLLVLGDWISRSLMAPFELPAGLMVSGGGGLYFIFLLLSGKYMQRR